MEPNSDIDDFENIENGTGHPIGEDHPVKKPRKVVDGSAEKGEVTMATTSKNGEVSPQNGMNTEIADVTVDMLEKREFSTQTNIPPKKPRPSEYLSAIAQHPICTNIASQLYLVISVLQIITGFVMMGDCSSNFIPVMLIIGGFLQIIVKEFTTGLTRISQLGSDIAENAAMDHAATTGEGGVEIDSSDEEGIKVKVNAKVLNGMKLAYCATLILYLLWIIIGAIGIYTTYSNVTFYKWSSYYGKEYCHPLLYWLLFWVATFSLGSIIIFFIIVYRSREIGGFGNKVLEMAIWCCPWIIG